MSAPLTTAQTEYGWRPDTNTFAAADVVPEALILQTSTVNAEVNGDTPSLHVAYVTDARDLTSGTGATYTKEGAEISDEAPGLDEVLVKTKKLSRLVSLSNEQFSQAGTAGAVAASVARDLVAKADNSYLGDDGTNDAPTGLLSYTGNGIVDAAGPVADSLDELIDLLATLESNGAVPSHIVLDPQSWARVRKLKVADTWNQTLLGAGTEDATPRLLGLPVLRSRFVPDNTGVVVDRNSIVSACGPVKVTQSDHARFSEDAVVLRATWRIGWQLVRPERVGRFTVADTDAGS
jgi:HK97 family phage major capsid protein